VKGHAYHLYVIQVKNRSGLYEYLKSQNIHGQVHYIPVHQLPYYRSLNKNIEVNCPNAESYYEHCLSLPMYPSLTFDEQTSVINAIKTFL